MGVYKRVHKPLAKIATFDIERYKKLRLEEDAAKGTINRELAALSTFSQKLSNGSG
jgi:hypothetical protein